MPQPDQRHGQAESRHVRQSGRYPAGGEQWTLIMRQQRLGWQPSRFLTDRADAERAFQLADMHDLAVAA